jgi:hypothetical protein
MWTAFPVSWANNEEQRRNGRKSFMTNSFSYLFNNMKDGKVAGDFRWALEENKPPRTPRAQGKSERIVHHIHAFLESSWRPLRLLLVLPVLHAV